MISEPLPTRTTVAVDVPALLERLEQGPIYTTDSLSANAYAAVKKLGKRIRVQQVVVLSGDRIKQHVITLNQVTLA